MAVAKKKFLNRIHKRKKINAVDPVFGGCQFNNFDSELIEESMDAVIPPKLLDHVTSTLSLLTTVKDLTVLGAYDLTWIAAVHPVLRVLTHHKNDDVACNAELALRNLRLRIEEYPDDKLSLNNQLICAELLGPSLSISRQTRLNSHVESFDSIQRFAKEAIARAKLLPEFLRQDGPRYRTQTQLIEQWEAICQLQTQVVRLQVLADQKVLSARARDKVAMLCSEWQRSYQDSMESVFETVMAQSLDIRPHNFALHNYKAAMMATHSLSTIPPNFSGRRLILKPSVAVDDTTVCMLRRQATEHFERFMDAYDAFVDRDTHKTKCLYRELSAVHRGHLRLLDHLSFVLYSLDIMQDGDDKPVIKMRTKLRSVLNSLFASGVIIGNKKNDYINIDTRASPWVCGACTFLNRANTKTCTMCKIGKKPCASTMEGTEIERKQMEMVVRESKLSRVLSPRFATYDAHEKEKWSLHLLTASLYTLLDVVPYPQREARLAQVCAETAHMPERLSDWVKRTEAARARQVS